MAQKETGAKTIINNGFLEKYMASAPTAYTLVYICAQKFIQEGNEYFTDEQLAQSLGMTCLLYTSNERSKICWKNY